MTGPAPLYPSPVHAAVEAAMSVATDFARWSVEQFLPDGGQRTARRNAWVAMGDEARHARDRREAEAALARAVRRSTALAVRPCQGAEPVQGAGQLVTAALHRTAPAAAEAAQSV
jgi:hypothetical protein